MKYLGEIMLFGTTFLFIGISTYTKDNVTVLMMAITFLFIIITAIIFEMFKKD